MKTAELKSILLEIINEILIGHRLKVFHDKNFYPAIITKNTKSQYGGEHEYRITWFDDKTMEPLNHLDFGDLELDHILTAHNFSPSTIKTYIELGLEAPKLIFENATFPNNKHIIVGEITDSGEIYAQKGGTHGDLESKYKQQLGMNWGEPWRYNPDTEMVYWHNHHPRQLEDIVQMWLENKKYNVRQHITLEYISNEKLYTKLRNNAHGIFEVKRTGPLLPTGADILVGAIDPDDNSIDAKYGGTHKTLQVRNNDKSRFRYNDYSEICYWLEAHPKIYERIVEEYIIHNTTDQKVKQHITLDNYRDNPIAYEYYWRDAHGIEQKEPSTYK